MTFDSDFFEKLEKIKLHFDMQLMHGMSGMRKSGAKGSSVEFSDFREYVPGDDIRRIDWNAYGRTDKLYIKQFMEEKEGLFQIFLDTSASMLFGEVPKSQMALQIAATYAYLIVNNLDRVFLHKCYENTRTTGKGMTGKASFARILSELEQIVFQGKTTLNRSILSDSIPTGGVSILISDFLDPNGIKEAVKYLAYKKQKIILIQVLAREELEVPYEGTVSLVDMEEAGKLRVTMSNAAVKQYQKAVAGHQKALRELACRYGAGFHTICSDEPLVVRFLQGFQGR